MTGKWGTLGCLGALALVAASLPHGNLALAQSSNSVTDPGRIQDRIERPKEFPKKVAPLITPAAPAAPAKKEARKFRLIGAEIVGSTVYSAARLGDFYEPYLNKLISTAEVDKIVKAITDLYQKDGYFLARVIAPAQSAEFGVLRLQVIEGYIEEVVYKGEKPGRTYLFDAWSRRITAERPARLSTLERNLLLMANVPGLSVTPSLKEKDAESGAYALEVELEHATFGGFASFDNRGTSAVGPMQLYTGLLVNSLAGALERTRLSVFTIPFSPEELQHYEVQQNHILNSHGTTGWLSFSRTLVDIGEPGVDKENSRGSRIILGFSHPWIRSRDQNLYTSIKFDGFNSDQTTPTSSFDDRIRSLRIGVQFDTNDDFGGSNFVSTEFSKGLDVFGASSEGSTNLSRTNGRTEYIKLTLDAGRTQKLTDGLHLQLNGSGQWSPHTLLSAEEFAIGGPRYGRGYDPSDISGSQGLAGSTELQVTPPEEIPIPDFINQLQLYGFYDIGAVWGDGFTRSSMASAGGGFRGALFKILRAQFEVAQPLTRPRTPGETGNDGPRVFFTLSAQF